MDSSRHSLPVLWTALSLLLTELLESSPPESVGHYHWPPTSSRRPIGPLRRKVYAYSLLSHWGASCAKAVGEKRAGTTCRVKHSRCAAAYQKRKPPVTRAASSFTFWRTLSIGALCPSPFQSRAGTAHCSPDECADAGPFRSLRAPYTAHGSWCRHRGAA